MSWKLAELRWRQDVGLHERIRVNGKEMAPEDHVAGMKRISTVQTGRGRSYTASWCQHTIDKTSTRYLNTEPIRPDQTALTFTAGTSMSSTTPLLKLTSSATNRATRYQHLGSDKRDTWSDASLDKLQTPKRFLSCKLSASPRSSDQVETVSSAVKGLSYIQQFQKYLADHCEDVTLSPQTYILPSTSTAEANVERPNPSVSLIFRPNSGGWAAFH